MTPEVSIVMTARNRAPLLGVTLETIARQGGFGFAEVIVVEDGRDDGETERLCRFYGARYFLRRNRPNVPYSNPAVPINIGLRQAQGEIVILQNAECRHVGNVISALAAPHRSAPNLAVFAAVSSLTPEGAHDHWYVHPTLDAGPRPFFFCGSMRRENFIRLEGMDESFKGYGWEDDFFAFQIKRAGIDFRFLGDAVVEHQWHPHSGFCYGIEETAKLYQEKMAAFARGELLIESNAGREWGKCDS